VPLFLTILEGENSEEARPIIASGDSRLIQAVAAELSRRLGDEETPSLRGLQLMKDYNPKGTRQKNSGAGWLNG